MGVEIRLTWTKSGDSNTICFHQAASKSKQINYIWTIKDEYGNYFSSSEEIKREAFHFYRNQLFEKEGDNINVKMNFSNMFPVMINEEDIFAMDNPILEEDLLQAIKEMTSDKSLGSDGWPIKLFSFLFNLMGSDLISMSKEFQVSCHIPDAIISTFLPHKPKKKDPISFYDYRPIFLCNVFYKMISMLLANIIKKIISPRISIEKFGFFF